MSVSIENINNGEEYNPLDYFRRMKDTLLKFLCELIKIDCTTEEDCNYIPRCILTDDEKSFIDNEFRRIALTNGYDIRPLCSHSCYDGCYPLDIHPDMSCSKCFGCSEYDKQKIYEYNDILDVSKYFKKSISNYAKNINLSYECSTECKYYSECLAGCMKYKLNKIEEVKKYLKWK